MEAFVHQVKGSKLVSTFGFPAVELKLPPGAWVVFAKADVTNVSSSSSRMGVECRLRVGNAEDKMFSVLSGKAADVHTVAFVPELGRTISYTVPALEYVAGDRETIALNVGVTLQDKGSIQLLCFAGQDNVIQISNITVTALPFDSVTTSVEDAEPEPVIHPGLDDKPASSQYS